MTGAGRSWGTRKGAGLLFSSSMHYFAGRCSLPLDPLLIKLPAMNAYILSKLQIAAMSAANQCILR